MRMHLNRMFVRPLPVVFSFMLQYFQFERVNGWKMSITQHFVTFTPFIIRKNLLLFYTG
jgi:hypothetical protein